jgi:PQQ-dependent dehydrogenase (methanol/ethanol family)
MRLERLVWPKASVRQRPWLHCVALAGAAAMAAIPALGQAADFSQAEKQFEKLCETCHGEGGGGGDRGPALISNRDLRSRNTRQIRDVIKNGTPGGMPAFPLPDRELQALAAWLHSLNLSAYTERPAGDVAAGEQFFFGVGRCSTCHMIHGRGKANGPDLSDIGLRSTVTEIALALDNPTSQMGIHTTPACPTWAFCPDEAWAVVQVQMQNGSTLRGFARNQAEHDLQLQTFDGRMHLLTEDDYQEITREKQSYMPPLKATANERRDLIAYLSSLAGSSPGPLASETEPISSEAIQAVTRPRQGEWPTYNGVPGGNRYSPLDQITTKNVSHLQLQWVHSMPGSGLETTPLVSDGVMYVTAPGHVCALDSRTGREIWCYAQSSGPFAGGRGNSTSDPNRGVAFLGDRVFFVTGDAHLICLHRLTGGVMWDVKMPVTPGPFSATSAPLVVGDLVISGIAGGDGPLRGFLAAYKATTGQLAWRFWTVPNAGEPGSETWKGNAIATGGGATWLTGSYDVQTDTLYWAVGNPFPATDGDEREGTNLYTNCVLALDAKTGKLRWYYQFTPHDLHDWDATEPFVLVDTTYQGRDRKLLLQANRNGFVYVLDRTNGELLLGTPFVKKLNWASAIGPDGKPQLLPANKPTKAGVKTCPSVRGATNWYSTSFHPETKLFYVMAVEDCSIYSQTQRGGYEGYRDPSDSGLKYLRAIDITTGKIVWEIPQIGPQEANYSGVLTTAGGLLFYGETGGRFAAVDAKTGKTLATFKATEPWKASPMTYMVNGRQHVAIASGGNILSFALGDR